MREARQVYHTVGLWVAAGALVTGFALLLGLRFGKKTPDVALTGNKDELLPETLQ